MNSPAAADEARSHGLLAEFADAGSLVAAATAARQAGYRSVEAFTPFPVEEVQDALGLRERRIAPIAIGAGTVGGLFGLLLQWYGNAIAYPINVGGRPLADWAAFALPAIELGLLFAALAAIGAMFVFNGLPRLHHPLFAVPRFERATSDRFFLLIRADDAKFGGESTAEFLRGCGSLTLEEVPG